MWQMTILNAFSEFLFFDIYYQTIHQPKSKWLLFILGLTASCFHTFVLYPLYYRYQLGPLSFSTLVSLALNCGTIIAI